MKKLGGLLAGAGLMLIIILRPGISGAEPEIPSVLINELAWAGSSANSADEWIELYNTTDQDIDMAGWQITKNTGTESLMLTLPNDPDPTTHIIPAQGYFLIANNGPDYDFGTGQLSVLNVTPNYITTAVTLSNDKLKLFLYDGPWDVGGKLIDVAGDGNAPFAGSNSAKTSMERQEIYGPGDAPASWHEATSANNLDAGVTDRATPATVNSPAPIAGPTLIKIVPNQAVADTIFEVDAILGENFVLDDTTQIRLEKGPTTIGATNVHVISSTTITQAKFNLEGTEVGDWDLTIINPDGQTATLPNALEILEPEEDAGQFTYSNDIHLSELYPHPISGGEEFIELYNSGDASINLSGWKLDDQSPGGSAEYTLPVDTIIGSHQYLVFPKSQTHLYLNDTGDFARLLQPNGTLIDSTPNYGTATAGYAYAKFNNNWQWTQRVSPNAANLYESIADEEEEDSPPKDTDPNSLQPNEITIKLAADDVTTTEALLTWTINLPGAIGNIKIYQSDKKGERGKEVGQTSPETKEYPIHNLLPKTKYFFTIVGAYNADDVASNQLEVTTGDSGTVLGETTGSPGQILISEILPNPESGKDEYIELFNPTDEEVDITGWRLTDASGKTYVITALDWPYFMMTDSTHTAVVLQPQQYILLKQPVTGIHLNNSGGEEVELLDANDHTIDTASYDGSAKQGNAYVLAPNGKWFWSSELTPGAPNDISFAAADGADYLVDSGKPLNLWRFFWLSLLFSAIMFAYLRKYGNPYLHHS